MGAPLKSRVMHRPMTSRPMTCRPMNSHVAAAGTAPPHWAWSWWPGWGWVLAE
jgi:hypothetical protein